jgi:hypothetical protein
MSIPMTFAVAIFTLINVLGLVMFAAFVLNPDLGLKFSKTTAGVDLNAIANRDKESNRALKFMLGYSSSQMLAANAFSLLIVWIPFRAYEAWAWYALLYWPVMFLWHFFHYTKRNALSYLQIIWFMLSASALFVTYIEFFSAD